MPCICKVVNYGQDINIIGPKKHLYLTSYPLEKVHYACNALTHCYHIPTIPIPGYFIFEVAHCNSTLQECADDNEIAQYFANHALIGVTSTSYIDNDDFRKTPIST